MKATKGRKRIITAIALLTLLIPAAGYAADLPFALMPQKQGDVPVSQTEELTMELPAVLPTDEGADRTAEPKVRRAVVLCDTNYRRMPSATSEVVGQAKIGESLDVYAVNVNSAWDAVMDENGQMVYIHNSAISITAPTYARDDHSDLHITDGGENGYPGEMYNNADYLQLIAEAKKYIGMPYVWGGSTPETSFDCSGYVCWVFNETGLYDLGRTNAQGIYDACEKISREEAKPGDLIFFQGTHEVNWPVTHVAIYVGNEYMLHCGKPIGYSRFDTPYWTEHFYAFGRL